MQLRTWSAFALYLGSYVPLSLILFAQDLDLGAVGAGPCAASAWKSLACRSPLHHPVASSATVMVTFACLLLTLWTVDGARGVQRIEVKDAKHVPADLLNYVIPYIPSFTGIDFGSPTKMLGFAVFFLWVFWITHKSGQIIMNPLLVAFGWRLYEIKYRYFGGDREFTGRALASIDLEPNGMYRQANLQDVMIIRTDEEKIDG